MRKYIYLFVFNDTIVQFIFRKNSCINLKAIVAVIASQL